jgi:hypothetical protein
MESRASTGEIWFNVALIKGKGHSQKSSAENSPQVVPRALMSDSVRR